MTTTILSPYGANGLSPRAPLPQEALERGSPSLMGHTYFSDTERKVQCVVWGATPYRIHPKQRSDYEFSILLEGSFTLTDGEGVHTQLSAGDAFVLPPNFTYQWGQDVSVLKYALSFTPSPPIAGKAVFTPFRAAYLSAPDPIKRQRLLFGDPAGPIRVTLEDLAEGAPGRSFGEGYTLLSVISGAANLTGADGTSQHLNAGQAAFVRSGTASVSSMLGTTRLLACTVCTC